MPSAETGAPDVAAVGKTLAVATISPKGRWRSPFKHVSSPKTTTHQSIISLADQSIVSATNFLTGVIIARTCSKAELGLYMLGFSIILLVTDLQSSLISTPYMVYAPRLKGRAHAFYTGSTLIHQLVFSLFTMLALGCGALAVMLRSGTEGLGPVMWALAAMIGLVMLREFARRVSFAQLKPGIALFFDSCIAVFQIAGLLALARAGILSASRAYWLIGLASGVAALGWLWSDSRLYRPKISESLLDLKKNLFLGKWVFASGLVWAISMNLYPWFLAFFHGPASAGVWAACLGVVSVGNPVLLGFQNIVGPKIAHVYAAEGSRALNRLVLKITALVSLPIGFLCLVMVFEGDRLLNLLYGRQYAGNSVVVALLALNLLVTIVTFSFSRALFAIGRANMDFLVNFAALFIMLTFGLGLVRAFGPRGAAIGMVGASLLTSIVRVGAFLWLSNSHCSDATSRVNEL